MREVTVPVVPERSAPEQKTVPVSAVRTMTRTSASVVASCNPAVNSSSSCDDRALRLCGESRVSVCTAPLRSEWTS